MTILNVTTITEWRGGDAGMYTVYHLLADKPDITQYILCPHDSVLAGKCKKDGAACFTYKKNALKLINVTKAIIRICKEHGVNVIHAHDSSALNAGLLAKRFLPKETTLIFTRKRNNPIKKSPLSRYKYAHPSISRIVCLSDAVAAIFDDVVKDKSKVQTIYDAVDVEKVAAHRSKGLLRRQLGLSEDTRIVGNVASLTDQKDIPTFIETAGLIMDRRGDLPVHFVIIGDGPLRDQMIAYAKEKQVDGVMSFIGFRDDVLDLLPEFDTLLLTSIVEGLPITIFEAFACKVPVVATKAGGVAEAVIHNGTGFVCNIKDTNCLADHVLDILRSPEFAHRLREKGYEKVMNEFNLPVLKNNYYNFYRSLTNKRL